MYKRQGQGRIHFAHLRNVKVNEAGDFYETGHRSQDGSLDMAEIMRGYYQAGYVGYGRPCLLYTSRCV